MCNSFGALICGCYQLGLWCLILTIGCYSINYFSGYDPYDDLGASKLSGLYDLARDWDRPFFVDLEVKQDGPCTFN